MGSIFALTGDASRAAHMYGAAEALRADFGMPVQISELDIYKRGLSAARTDLTEDAFQQAWKEGRSMTLDEAIEFVLGVGVENDQ